MNLAIKYKAFISYKHAGLSELHAVLLEKHLKTYAKHILQPPIKIFRDEQQLKIGANLPERIKDALNNSDYLIYLASGEAAKSIWVQDELLYWCDSLKKTDKLIIILIDGIIDIDIENKKINWENTTSIPGILKDYIESIPLYADFINLNTENHITVQNIDYKKAINNISACLKGVTPEEMNGEEIKIYKKNKFLRNAAIFIISILGIISIITSILAIYQKDIAVKQRNKANALYLTKVSEDYYKEDRTKSLGFALYSHLLDSNLTEPIRLINNVMNYSPDLDRVAYLQFLGEHHSISLDDKKVVSLYNNHICIWNSNGDLLKKIPSESNDIIDLGFSSNGNNILECSRKQIGLWNTNGNKIWRMETNENYMSHPTFSPNDFFILVYGENKSFLYTKKGKLLDVLPKMSSIYFVFTKDSKNIIIPNQENTYIYNIETKEKKTINEVFVEFSKDQQKILFRQKDGISVYNKYFQRINTIKIGSINRFNCMFSTKGDKILLLSDTIRMYGLNGVLCFNIVQKEKYGNNACFSNSGNVFLTYGWNNMAYLWNSNGKLIGKYFNYQPVKFAKFINSDKEIITISKNNFIQIRKNDSNLTLQYWNRADNLEVEDIRLSHDETYLFTFHGIVNLLKWNISHPKELFNISGGNKFLSCDQSLDFNKILLLTKDNIVTVYDSLGTVIKKIKIENARFIQYISNSKNTVVYCNNKDNSTSITKLYDVDFKLIQSFNSDFFPVFSIDGKYVLLNNKDKILIINNINRSILEIEKMNDSFLGISNDNKYIFQANYKGVVQLFNTKGELLKIFKIPSGNIDYITFSPDNSMILIRLFENILHQQELLLYKINGELIKSRIFWYWNSNFPRFTSDSKKILVSGNNILQLWQFLDDDYQKEVISLKAVQSFDIISSSLSPDNNYFAVSYKDNSINIFNNKCELISTYNHKSPITYLHFSKDGSMLFAGSINEAKIWFVPSVKTIKKLKNKYITNSIQNTVKELTN